MLCQPQSTVVRLEKETEFVRKQIELEEQLKEYRALEIEVESLKEKIDVQVVALMD